MNGALGSVFSGFGLSGGDYLTDILGGAVEGAGSGAASGGGWVGTLIGAVGGAVEGYFQAEAAETMANAALEAAQMQTRGVQEQQRGALELIRAQTRLARTLGGAAPAGTVPTLAGTTPTTVVGGLIPGRSFATGGDTMTLLPGYQQGALGFDLQSALGGAADVLSALGYGSGAPTGTVQQPPAVVTGPAGLPLPGQSGAGALAPGGLFSYPSAMRATPIREIMQVNPQTGKLHVWRHMGRPILFSGDLAACRRVDRVSKRVSKARRRRAP